MRCITLKKKKYATGSTRMARQLPDAENSRGSTQKFAYMGQNLHQIGTKSLIKLLIIEWDGASCVADASSTSNAVDVVIDLLGQVVIDDKAHTLNVCKEVGF